MRRVFSSLGPLGLLGLLALLALPASVPLGAQSAPQPARAPDDRFKLDLLLFVAHPDDDTLAGTYLARAIVDEHRQVGVVFATPGDSGGNQEGTERGPALGVIRQIEARRDLATLGISRVWFLDGHDTAGQDPLRSLANWGHGRALADAVRLIRVTRPEVVLTWTPMQVAGENHGDHQASAVLATEAFDLAGDPTAFPEQLAAPTQMFENLLEGLRPWQPKKLYFMSDAITTAFMNGHGPSYPVTATSKEGKKYWEYVYEQLKSHRTQYRQEIDALDAADRDTRERLLIHAAPGDALIDPLRLIRGKSLVGGSIGADVFDGIAAAPIPFVPAPGYRPVTASAPTLAMGGPWRFYRAFWQAHGLDALTGIDLHEIGPVGSGAVVRVPLTISNPTDAPIEVTVTAQLPTGWREEPRATAFVVPANGEVQFGDGLVGHAPPTGNVVHITYQLGGGNAGNVPLGVDIVFHPGGNPLPQ